MALHNLGTVPPGKTLRLPFTTYDSNDPSNSVTVTAFVAADIEIYKDGGTTQRASDAGYTVTVDFDTVTGSHLVVIDLADNTTAGFFAAGSHYDVIAGPMTIDAATGVVVTLASFDIGYEGAFLNTTIATLSTQTSFTLTSGPAEDDALNGCVVCIHDVASAIQLGFAAVSDYTGATKTVTLTAGVTFTVAATDNISFYPPANTRWFGATAQAGDGSNLTETGGDGAQLTEAGGTGDHLTAINLPNQTMDITGNITGNLSGSVGSVTGAVGSVTGAVGSVSGNVDGNVTGSVGSNLELGPTEVNAEVDTALADIGLDHLISAAVIGTDVTDNSIIARMVASGVTADWDTFVNTTESLQALRDHIADGTSLTEAGGTGDHLTAINLPNQTMDIVGNITGNLSGSVGSVTGAVGSVTGAVGSVAGNVDGNVTGSVGSNLELGPAEVNAEVVDALNVDTYAEPAQGTPAATASLVTKLGFLYKAWRNRSNQTATTYQLFNDDALTVDHKATVSDDATTAEKGEVITGP